MQFFKAPTRNLLQDGDFIMLQTRVSNLEMEIGKFISQIISLRGFVNRNLEPKNYKRDRTETEDIKSPDGLDELRNHGNNSSSVTDL